ncbi:unnamed protein product [Nezara viridula]|uniref:Uncharacterized protein n=1 Tax=Nezara viridula TaxID=85310 RepID=A0A9P0HB67_NEZVI|nr:unnamed protein product [Nezara viridula]
MENQSDQCPSPRTEEELKNPGRVSWTGESPGYPEAPSKMRRAPALESLETGRLTLTAGQPPGGMSTTLGLADGAGCSGYEGGRSRVGKNLIIGLGCVVARLSPSPLALVRHWLRVSRCGLAGTTRHRKVDLYIPPPSWKDTKRPGAIVEDIWPELSFLPKDHNYNQSDAEAKGRQPSRPGRAGPKPAINPLIAPAPMIISYALEDENDL